MMKVLAGVSAAALLAGCASDGGFSLATGSVDQNANTAKVAAVDPACKGLATKIARLRQEGTPSRVAKVAAGKTPTVTVKRSALARLTDLNKANAEFQLKCSKVPIQAVAPAPVAPKVKTAKAAGKTAATAKKPTTSAASTAPTKPATLSAKKVEEAAKKTATTTATTVAPTGAAAVTTTAPTGSAAATTAVEKTTTPQ